LIQVRKDEFLKMMENEILDGKHKGFKNFSVTSRSKNSKRKKYYVSEPDYKKFKNKGLIK
jgi:hypothetical protein